MITREKYNEALDIIEEYHKQLFSIDSINDLRNNGKTKVQEWDKLVECSTRLYNILMGNNNILDNEPLQTRIEDLRESEFYRYRYAGNKTWIEFKMLRGY